MNMINLVGVCKKKGVLIVSIAGTADAGEDDRGFGKNASEDTLEDALRSSRHLEIGGDAADVALSALQNTKEFLERMLEDARRSLDSVPE